MTLCAFAMVASEFMPVSLLTPIARDLAISEGLAGQAIAVSGACAVVTSLYLASLAARIDRKALLLCLSALMLVSALLIALAPDYTVYMGGRVLIGIAIGGFWSLSASSAMRLVPHEKISRALAVVNGGNAMATVVAAPLGSYLGSLIGWRGAFLALVPVALLALLWQWRALPAMPVQRPVAAHAQPRTLLRQPLIALGMAAVSLFFMGQFTLFTYLRPFLENVTGVDAHGVSLILLAIGVAGFIGTLLIGPCLQRHFYRTLVAIPLIMAAIAVALVLRGSDRDSVALLLTFWGLVATAAPVGWWSWVARSLPDAAEAGGGLMVALVQLAIGLGSTLGGGLFDHGGYRASFLCSALLLMAAAVLATLTAARDAHQRA